MPKTKHLLVDDGLTFKNAFVSTPICCVSRSSIISGRYTHNHRTFINNIKGGCASAFWQNEIEPTSMAVPIESAGFRTFYAGKYLNEYGVDNPGGRGHVPLGWTEWKALAGNAKYYKYRISDNGETVQFGEQYDSDYYTDVIKRQSIDFLQQHGESGNVEQPFFMVIATPSCHMPVTPAPHYNVTNLTALRTPNWNRIPFDSDGVNTKHAVFNKMVSMNDEVEGILDFIYSQRIGTLKSVDDLVEAVYGEMESMGLLNDSIFLFASDHGYHLGQFGMGFVSLLFL